MGTHNVTKAIAIVSFLLGISVLTVTIWTFISQIDIRIENEESSLQNTDPDPASEDGLSSMKNSTSGFFKGLIICCDCIAIIGAFLQISTSMLIICTSAENVGFRSKYFIGFHFLAFMILLTMLFVPLAYDEENDAFHSMTSFNSKAKNIFSKFNMKEEKNINILIQDLYLYYGILIIDCISLFLIITIVSCLMRYSSSLESGAGVDFYYDRYR